MPYSFITLSFKNHLSSILLHRPPVNALNRALVAELTELARDLKNNSDVWLVSVTAEGKTFCAGADLKERATIPREEVLSVVEEIQGMAKAWSEIPQPVIMGINGAALGGGLEFALAGDILVASSSALLGFPETSLGIIPAAGGTQKIAQRVSMGIAKKWILSANSFSAQEAKEDGVVDFILQEKNFSSEFSSFVSRFSANSPLAMRQAKRAIESYYQEWLNEGFEHELSLYGSLICTEDREEALKAFREKRKPLWKGK